MNVLSQEEEQVLELISPTSISGMDDVIETPLRSEESMVLINGSDDELDLNISLGTSRSHADVVSIIYFILHLNRK